MERQIRAHYLERGGLTVPTVGRLKRRYQTPPLALTAPFSRTHQHESLSAAGAPRLSQRLAAVDC